MIGLDTNILLRYLLNDDADQSPRVYRFFEDQLSATNPAYVNLTTILEIVWVLRTSLKRTPREIALSVREILVQGFFVVQNREEVAAATYALQRGTGEFEDALIGALNRWSGCTESVTFDQKAARLPYFRLLA